MQYQQKHNTYEGAPRGESARMSLCAFCSLLRIWQPKLPLPSSSSSAQRGSSQTRVAQRGM
eukprot:5294318-Heterocapsa_arctica.AAC.1